MAFSEVGIELGFRGEGENEVGFVIKCNGDYELEAGKIVVKVDSKYYRPTEVDLLLGDPTKAKSILGWVPKYDLKALVEEMVSSDLLIFKNIKN
jgi:GDPmannose 4,6-dehydratase